MSLILITIIIVSIAAIIFTSSKIISFFKIATTTTFMVHYNLAVESGKNQRDAIESAINFFRYREPFKSLTDEDVKNLSDFAVKLTDPLSICKILQVCENNRSIDVIKEILLKKNKIHKTV